MIDKVIDFNLSENPTQILGRKVRAQKNVTINEPYFMGHFPHRPVMPGVMQLEGMAQAAAICCYSSDTHGKDVLIAGANNARFRKPVVPGDIIIFEAEVVKYKTRIAIIQCRSLVDGKVVSEAEVMAAIGS